MIDVRLSEQARDQLTRLKRATGIKTWNILCRWAFCVSLAEGETIGDTFDSNESAIEIRWDVFGGEYQHAYQAILADECYKNGQEVNDRSLGRLARQHIQRGANLRACPEFCVIGYSILQGTYPQTEWQNSSERTSNL